MIQKSILSNVSSPFLRFVHRKNNNIKPIINNIKTGMVTPMIIVVVFPPPFPPPPSVVVVVEVKVVVVVVVVVVVDVANLRQCIVSLIKFPLS